MVVKHVMTLEQPVESCARSPLPSHMRPHGRLEQYSERSHRKPPNCERERYQVASYYTNTAFRHHDSSLGGQMQWEGDA